MIQETIKRIRDELKSCSVDDEVVTGFTCKKRTELLFTHLTMANRVLRIRIKNGTI